MSSMQKIVINKLKLKNNTRRRINYNYRELVIIYRFEIFRSHADFSLTFVNNVSRILLEFLILFTFDQSEYNNDFDKLGFIIFQNFEDILGSYSYSTICQHLKLTQVVKKFNYFKKIMLNERCAPKKHLFIETKSIIYYLFYDKTDIIYSNGLRGLSQKYLFLLNKL